MRPCGRSAVLMAAKIHVHFLWEPTGGTGGGQTTSVLLFAKVKRHPNSGGLFKTATADLQTAIPASSIEGIVSEGEILARKTHRAPNAKPIPSASQANLARGSSPGQARLVGGLIHRRGFLRAPERRRCDCWLPEWEGWFEWFWERWLEERCPERRSWPEGRRS